MIDDCCLPATNVVALLQWHSRLHTLLYMMALHNTLVKVYCFVGEIPYLTPICGRTAGRVHGVDIINSGRSAGTVSTGCITLDSAQNKYFSPSIKSIPYSIYLKSAVRWPTNAHLYHTKPLHHQTYRSLALLSHDFQDTGDAESAKSVITL